MHELVGIAYSPWSWRAKAALRGAGVAFTTSEFLPTLGEPRLRWRLGRWTGSVSVPVLLPDDGPAVADSVEIAAWADARSPGSLIPAGRHAEVRHWAALGDTLAAAGRGLTTRKVLEDPEALRGSLPRWARQLGPVGMAIGRDAASRLLRKYGADREPVEVHRARLAEGLEALRAGLAGGEHLLGEPSWADAAASVGLSFVTAHADAPLKGAARAAWHDAELAERYADLLAWRDRVVAAAGGWR